MGCTAVQMMHTGNIFWDFLPFEGDIVVCPKPDGKISLHKLINILGQQSQKISSSVKVKLSTIQVILKVSMTILIWNSRDSLQWIAIMSHSLIYSFFLSNKAAFMFLMKDWTGLYCKERSQFISNLYLYSHFISLKIILRLKPFKYSLLQDQNVKEEYFEMVDLPKKTGTWSISASPGLFAFSLHPAHKVFWLFVSKLPCPVFYHRGQVHKTL